VQTEVHGPRTTPRGGQGSMPSPNDAWPPVGGRMKRTLQDVRGPCQVAGAIASSP